MAKNKYDRCEPKTTTELQATDLGQAHTEGGRFKHVYEHSFTPYIGQWCTSTT